LKSNRYEKIYIVAIVIFYYFGAFKSPKCQLHLQAFFRRRLYGQLHPRIRWGYRIHSSRCAIRQIDVQRQSDYDGAILQHRPNLTVER